MIISDWSSDLKVDASSTFAHIVEYVFLKKSHIWRHCWDLSWGLLGLYLTLQTDNRNCVTVTLVYHNTLRYAPVPQYP